MPNEERDEIGLHVLAGAILVIALVVAVSALALSVTSCVPAAVATHTDTSTPAPTPLQTPTPPPTPTPTAAPTPTPTMAQMQARIDALTSLVFALWDEVDALEGCVHALRPARISSWGINYGDHTHSDTPWHPSGGHSHPPDGHDHAIGSRVLCNYPEAGGG